MVAVMITFDQNFEGMERKQTCRRLGEGRRSKITLADEIRVRSIKDLREAFSTPNIQVQAGLFFVGRVTELSWLDWEVVAFEQNVKPACLFCSNFVW
jgi:hypothetical protein